MQITLFRKNSLFLDHAAKSTESGRLTYKYACGSTIRVAVQKATSGRKEGKEGLGPVQSSVLARRGVEGQGLNL